MVKRGELKQLLTRYALTGGAIGLYFGLFFRPLREANFGYALLLALLVAVVMSGLHLWQKRPSLSTLPATFAITFVKAALALTLLEGRHLAFDFGGKTAVIIFTVIMGAATGLWFAFDKSRNPIFQKIGFLGASNHDLHCHPEPGRGPRTDRPGHRI